MFEPARSLAPAFRRLRRALLRRRLRRLDPVLRVELLLIAALVGAGLAWQARLPLDRLARTSGPAAVAGALALAAVALAALGGLVAAGDHARRLLRAPRGPEWASLPVPAALVARQAAWESEPLALLLLPAWLGVVAAGAGLAPAWALGLLALAGAGALRPAARGGAALARALRLALAPRTASGADREQRLRGLFETARPASRRRLPPARWQGGVTRALLRRDLTRSLRRTPARPRALAWAAALVLAALVWVPPLEPVAAGAFSVVLVLAAAVALAEWAIDLSAGDPYALLAALPLAARRVWSLRALFVCAAAVLAGSVPALAAQRLEPAARAQLAASLGLATLLIGLLGVTYGVTLFPRVEAAGRLLVLWLALAVGASVAFPLAGWLVLLGALLHALRRLPGRVTLAADIAAGEA